jgi:3-phosphoshikimate 1-carboxyvinyltransferase
MKKKFTNISKVCGELSLPGDKSISHRAIIFSALADGKSIIKNLADSHDVNTTIECFSKLGVNIVNADKNYIIEGVGFKGFNEPDSPLYCGNSGTTSRLISGVLAVQDFPSVIIGDESLSNRPMDRIIEPLKKIGCNIKSTDGKLPLHFLPSNRIKAIDYILPLASAQVKGAVLLAGLQSKDFTIIQENNLFTRDHTEKMLNLPIEIIGRKKITKISSAFYPKPANYFIPGDISTAAFFIVLALLSKNSNILLRNISLNETRTNFLNLLISMGAEISITPKGSSNNEPYGDVTAKSSEIKNIEIEPDIVPGIIDEIPILSIAGALAEDNFVIRGAKELRVKESDRIKSVCLNLMKAGFNIKEFDDGFSINGKLESSYQSFESYGDHRIAMAFGVLASLMEEGSELNGFECVSVSNPNFLNQLQSISELS